MGVLLVYSVGYPKIFGELFKREPPQCRRHDPNLGQKNQICQGKYAIIIVWWGF
jgi:hypothetical protein